MKNSSIRLSDLQESNINQLLDSQMLMVRGGSGSKGSKKKSKKGSKKKSGKGGSGYGCNCGCW
jgi:hypothetical protein